MFNKTILMSATAILMATTALAQSSRDDIIQELTDEGYTRIEITRTLFGNTKFEASGPTAEREIVLGKDGTILRDRTEIEDDDGDDGDDDLEDDLEEEEEDDDGEDGDDDGEDGDDDGDDGDDDGDDGDDDGDDGDDGGDDGDDGDVD